MFNTLKIRRAAAHLTASFPDIGVEEARTRAGRLLGAWPALSADAAGRDLIHGERLSRAIVAYSDALRRS
jgi:hypothetical protein